jgi:hypothetical protein
MTRFGATSHSPAPAAFIRSVLSFLYAALIALAALCPATPSAGDPLFLATNPTAYMPVSNVWRGASVFGTGKPVTVHFVHSIADWGNQLFFMDPASGKANPLLLYHGSGQGNRCPDSGGLVADLGVRDSSEELVFMLRTISSAFAGKYCTGEACGPRYTGMNDFSSRFRSSGEFKHLQGMLWAEAQRIPRETADSLPPPCQGGNRIPPGEEGVLFSFNDGANDSYEDLVIFVTGVEMDVERRGIIPKDTTAPKPEPVSVACALEAKVGGVLEGEAFTPRRVELPLSAIRPRGSPLAPRYFLDQEWRTRYPGRPDETAFPNGPEIRVTAPRAFSFNLGFFTNQGEFVNRAKGDVTPEMFRLGTPAKDGRRTVSLMWYPVSLNGNRVGTGAYVVKGWIKTTPRTPGSADPATACDDAKANLLSAFGYLRH